MVRGVALARLGPLQGSIRGVRYAVVEGTDLDQERLDGCKQPTRSLPNLPAPPPTSVVDQKLPAQDAEGRYPGKRGTGLDLD